ncbi:MAG: response regulator transcription factor [Rivularia sp. (in: cyanobacteria)]
MKEQGFTVDYCNNGDEGYLLAVDNEYDAILLDIMLSGKDGLSILKQLRREGRNTPIILLTARNELDDRLSGLNLGADDYIAKPFFVEELVARIHAVIRRSVGERQNFLVVEALKLDRITREVTCNKKAIELTKIGQCTSTLQEKGGQLRPFLLVIGWNVIIWYYYFIYARKVKVSL